MHAICCWIYFCKFNHVRKNPTVQVFLPYKLNKKDTLTEKVNYSTRVRVADLSTLQTKNALYIYTVKYFIFKKPTTAKKSTLNQELSKHTSNKNAALMCICAMEAKTSSLNKKEVFNVT